MINTKKTFLPLMVLMISPLTFAAATGDIALTANLKSGCTVSGEPFNFGENVTSTSTVNANLFLQCSKGTIVTITGSDNHNNNAQQLGGPRMWKDGETIDKAETRIGYMISSFNLVTSPIYSVIQYPKSMYIWKDTDTIHYTLKLKTLNGEKATLPMMAQISSSFNIGTTSGSTPFDPHKIVYGSYNGNFTYNLSY